MNSKQLREKLQTLQDKQGQTFIYTADQIDAILSAVKDHVEYIIGEDEQATNQRRLRQTSS